MTWAPMDPFHRLETLNGFLQISCPFSASILRDVRPLGRDGRSVGAGMSQNKHIVSAIFLGTLVMTGIVISGCAIRVPSSETPAMNLAGEPATVVRPAASASTE